MELCLDVEYKRRAIYVRYVLLPSLANLVGTDNEAHVFEEVTKERTVSGLDSNLTCSIEEQVKRTSNKPGG